MTVWNRPVQLLVAFKNLIFSELRFSDFVTDLKLAESFLFIFSRVSQRERKEEIAMSDMQALTEAAARKSKAKQKAKG